MANVRVLLPLLLTVIKPAGCTAVYDYIIVGGGNAGLVAASRLSENANVQVLAIEAGYSALNETDLSFPELSQGNKPQNNADGKTRMMAAGKGIGGSTIINGMQYIRAEDAQIDAWERAGNMGWTWDNLFPYYKKSERLIVPTKKQSEKGALFEPLLHGFQGPVRVGWQRQAQQDGFFLTVKETFGKFDIPLNVDTASGKTRGVSAWPRTVTPGNEAVLDVRADSARSYYYPVQGRPNLHMMAGTTALRLLWEASKTPEDSAVANAVEVVLLNGERKVFNATSDVIMACGAFRTPALLEHSGVGNPSILSQNGIKTVVNIPGVGENLMDQALTLFFFNATSPSENPLTPSYPTIADLYGPNATAFASAIHSALPSYAAVIAASNNDATPAASILRYLELQHDLLFNRAVPCAELQHGTNGPNLTAQAWSTMPFARGSVHIRSSDPLAAPSIDPRYWQLPYDMSTHVAAARYVRSLYGTAPLKELHSGEISPGGEAVPEDGGDEAWKAWIKANYFPARHAMGTASMLPRVGDFTNGHPSSTVYAVAEYCSDLIKEDRAYMYGEP
ncbi:putative glucose oxidase [Macrophomina phaseolina]|uniref:Glucose oxidase n=1 Tax=Macrophomina phaseolina TaxID=35725 RepID=A0ABQ8GAU2_9PEZI|nr:putative glucose oxidase [Macrophomina phaseolina]